MKVKLPLYKNIAKEIIQDGEAGLYSAHQKLPSESDLAKKYNTSRVTIRKTLEYLIEKRIVIKDKSKGNYLTKIPKIESGKAGLVSFTEAANQVGMSIKTEIVEFSKIEINEVHIKDKLKLIDDSTAYNIQRIRYGNEVPLTFEKIYISDKICPCLEESDAKCSLYEAIEKNVQIGYSHQEIEAGLVDEKISKLLQVKVGDPVLVIHSTTFTINGYPILYDKSYYRADKYKFSNILYRNNG